MKQLVFSLTLLMLFVATASAQNSIVPISAEEQARIKPLVAAENKAREALNAKIATLPESKAYSDAQEALKKAADALNKAADLLPESSALKLAAAAAWDEAYRIQASHQLSSREYQPELNEKGELVIVKKPPVKQ